MLSETCKVGLAGEIKGKLAEGYFCMHVRLLWPGGTQRVWNSAPSHDNTPKNNYQDLKRWSLAPNMSHSSDSICGISVQEMQTQKSMWLHILKRSEAPLKAVVSQICHAELFRIGGAKAYHLRASDICCHGNRQSWWFCQINQVLDQFWLGQPVAGVQSNKNTRAE